MVRLYKTKNLRAQWSEEDAGIAVAAVEGENNVVKEKLPMSRCTTLRRKLKLKRCVSSMKTVLVHPTILKPQQEVEYQRTQQSSSPIRSTMILFHQQLHRQKCPKHHFQTFLMQKSLQ